MHTEVTNQIPESPPLQPALPIAWPKDAKDVRDFFHADFISAKFAAADQTPCNEDQYLISAHDFLSAVNWWANFPHVPRVDQAAPLPLLIRDIARDLGITALDACRALKDLVEETEATDAWRQLALQFDGHRMQALGYLKALLRGEKDMETGARGFIASPPIPGEQVLAERLAAIAWQPAPHGWKLVPVEPTREMMDAYVNQDGRFHSARSDWVAMLAASPTPPGLKREPLTDEQISGLNLQAWKGGGNVTLKFARNIETAHGIRCWCSTCRPITLQDMRFVVCPKCGNKRCPRAHNHELACTGSNAVGQPGSSWEHVKPISEEKLG